MKLTSAVIAATASPMSAAARSRALRPSRETTRGSLASFGWSWPCADVDRVNLRGAALEQHLGEAAGRGAEVEGDAAGRRVAEMVERGDEFQAPARDVVDGRIEERDRRSFRDRHRRPGGGNAVDRDDAAQDRVARPRPARQQAALDEGDVEAGGAPR